MDMTSYVRRGCSDLDEIWQPDAEKLADYGEMVVKETGSRIPSFADVCISKTEIVISQPPIEISRRNLVC